MFSYGEHNCVVVWLNQAAGM